MKEISLVDFLGLFPKQYNDHRDFYLAAYLFLEGYVDWEVRYTFDGLYNNSKYKDLDRYIISVNLYLNSLGAGEQEYNGIKVDNTHAFEKDPIFITPKTDLYFQNRRSEAITIIVNLSVGIIIAIISASLTAYFLNE